MRCCLNNEIKMLIYNMNKKSAAYFWAGRITADIAKFLQKKIFAAADLWKRSLKLEEKILEHEE